MVEKAADLDLNTLWTVIQVKAKIINITKSEISGNTVLTVIYGILSQYREIPIPVVSIRYWRYKGIVRFTSNNMRMFAK